MIAAGPRGRNDDGIDDAGQHADAGLLGGDDPGRRGGVARVAQQARVVGRHDEPDDEQREDVEDEDAQEDATRRPRYVAPRVLGLGRRDRRGLDPRKRVDGVDEDGEEAALHLPRRAL